MKVCNMISRVKESQAKNTATSASEIEYNIRTKTRNMRTNHENNNNFNYNIVSLHKQISQTGNELSKSRSRRKSRMKIRGSVDNLAIVTRLAHSKLSLLLITLVVLFTTIDLFCLPGINLKILPGVLGLRLVESNSPGDSFAAFSRSAAVAPAMSSRPAAWLDFWPEAASSNFEMSPSSLPSMRWTNHEHHLIKANTQQQQLQSPQSQPSQSHHRTSKQEASGHLNQKRHVIFGADHLVDFIERRRPPPQSASLVMTMMQQNSKPEGKSVLFLHFESNDIIIISLNW